MTAAPASAEPVEQYLTAHERARRTRSGKDPSWLMELRERAMDRFQALGLPTTRDEEWRFTSVAPIAEGRFELAAGAPSAPDGADAAPVRFPARLAAELVFVNGHYVPALSTVGPLPPGACIGSLAASLSAGAGDIEPYLTHLAPFDRQAFTALNTALFADGAYIRIPAHMNLEDPIQVLFISTEEVDGRPTMSHPRVLVVLGDDSHASIVESYAGPGGGRYFTNAVTEIVLGESAVLDHYKLQRESARAYHIGTTTLRTQRNANVTSHSISLGGSLVRNDVNALLDGEGGECTLNGLYLADERRHVDNHTTIDHAQPHCGSRELYKGILADHARGVFNGKIIVRPDAQKTDARQTNRALLLSEDAQINTKPQLEIFANDVRCTHGAAVGQMDDEAVFYLRSRGLSEAQARHLLIQAFAGDVLSRMRLEPIRTGVEGILNAVGGHFSRTVIPPVLTAGSVIEK